MTEPKGLEGVIAAKSSVSSIEDGVLTYRGYHIDDLTENTTFEEVLHLLWEGRLPTQEELKTLIRALAEQATLPPAVVAMLHTVPQDANPMAVLRTAVSMLALFDPLAHQIELPQAKQAALQLQAKIPAIVATFARIRAGQSPIDPLPEATVAEQFLYLLRGVRPDHTSVKALDQALILHADHELNASTFAARVTVATLSDVYSGVTSAIGALRGPLHGGANEAVMAMLEEIGSVDRVESYLTQKFENKEKIMGFGHRVYKDGDPRAKHLKKMSKQLAEQQNDSRWYEMSVRIEDIVGGGKKQLKPNVDFYSASVYTALGIPRDLFTPLFAVSRVSGWTAHIIEQYADNRLIRPRAEYVGPRDQTVNAIVHR